MYLFEMAIPKDGLFIPLQQFQGEGRLCFGFRNKIDTLVLINTHLDLWDQSEATRQKQIQEIEMFLQSQKLGHQITLLVGDFNTVRRKDYQSEPIWMGSTISKPREKETKKLVRRSLFLSRKQNGGTRSI